MTLLPGSALLGDEVIDRIISSGVFIRTAEDLRKQVRWYLAFDSTGAITQHGQNLLAKLAPIYTAYEEESQQAKQPNPISNIDPDQFYSRQPSQTRGASSSSRGRGRGRGRGLMAQPDAPEPRRSKRLR
jgi:hypothetical protein